jgi:1-acyl-sn-glycerol-3-phosphate acyltransferase
MDIVYPPVVMSSYGLFGLLNIKFDIVGGEHVPRSGGAVLASNHVSYLDFIFCGRAARPSNRLVRFMAKKSTFDHVVSGPLMRSMHHIPVDRAAGSGAYSHAVDSLRSGEIVGVFPEATISQSFEIKTLKSGAARMAMEAQVPLVPMITFGGQRIWTKGRPRSWERGVIVALTVGEPMHPTADDDPDAVMAELQERLRGLLDATLERYPDKPGPGAWWWPQRLGGGAPSLAEMEVRDAQVAAERAAKRAASGEAPATQ